MSSPSWNHNSTGTLRSVLVTKPTYYELEPVSDTARDAQDRGEAVDHAAAQAQHDEMVLALKEEGVDVVYAKPDSTRHWAVYARDWGLVTKYGALVGRYRYLERKGEEIQAEEALREYGVPIIGHITKGAFEGGDLWFIDENTLACGCGNRSTNSGIDQATELLKPHGIECITVEFHSKWNHLDMIFSVVADKLAVGCSAALPPYFLGVLRGKGYTFIDFPAEVAKGTTFLNLLPLGKDRVLSLKQNKVVNAALEAHGLKVLKPDLGQFLMGGGGPHCLTHELIREDK